MDIFYIILGKTVLFSLFLIISIKWVLPFIWYINQYYYTWLYQVVDYYIFKNMLKDKEKYSIKDCNDMIDIFQKDKRIKNGLFFDKAIKLLENYKRNLIS